MSMAPMSRAQWEAESSKVRQVFDPATGRVRLTTLTKEFFVPGIQRAGGLRAARALVK